MCGPDTLKTLDLGDKFDTSKVVDMGLMFSACGKNTLETLNLGGKFKINVNMELKACKIKLNYINYCYSITTAF